MIKFKEFLRECLLNERKDYLDAYTVRRRVNDYRNSIGLPAEDEIPEDAIWQRQIAVEEPKKNQGIQSSVEDEARRRIKIEDDLMTPIDAPNDTDTPRERQDKLINRINQTFSDIHSNRIGSPWNHEDKRLKDTRDNIVNDRKAQLPVLAQKQEELTKEEEKLKQKEKFVGNLGNMIPYEAPQGTTKIVNYLRNFLLGKHTNIMNDWNKNTRQQEEMPWSDFYGTHNIPTKTEFEQTRTFTADPAVAVPQENEQGIRLGRVDYSRKNK